MTNEEFERMARTYAIMRVFGTKVSLSDYGVTPTQEFVLNEMLKIISAKTALCDNITDKITKILEPINLPRR